MNSINSVCAAFRAVDIVWPKYVWFHADIRQQVNPEHDDEQADRVPRLGAAMLQGRFASTKLIDRSFRGIRHRESCHRMHALRFLMARRIWSIVVGPASATALASMISSDSPVQAFVTHFG
ncbi:hypothetical protein GY21_08805 [Cryobacterium roopkundense]|uniref:Uncharacterized protein n=1 Tax=Cryobacterium roopkundense TaxID=1001240 RepID=A0A099JFW6_9MICO|nr:hypothetical protein [Cryobacterium roopkundense]KGJ76930.1 hypothetical protein GY21_08805 [Cryobacterium roopkundense]MBB5643171.1 hypothetical protein [Cryobacterium roopkundense]